MCGLYRRRVNLRCLPCLAGRCNHPCLDSQHFYEQVLLERELVVVVGGRPGRYTVTLTRWPPFNHNHHDCDQGAVDIKWSRSYRLFKRRKGPSVSSFKVFYHWHHCYNQSLASWRCHRHYDLHPHQISLLFRDIVSVRPPHQEPGQSKSGKKRNRWNIVIIVIIIITISITIFARLILFCSSLPQKRNWLTQNFRCNFFYGLTFQIIFSLST